MANSDVIYLAYLAATAVGIVAGLVVWGIGAYRGVTGALVK